MGPAPAMPETNAMAMASHEGHWADGMAGMAMCQGMCQGLEGAEA